MKFKDLKNKFHKEYKQVELSTRSGASSDETYVPTFSHYEILTFLKKTFEVDAVVSFGNLQDNSYDAFFEESDMENLPQSPDELSSQNLTPLSINPFKRRHADISNKASTSSNLNQNMLDETSNNMNTPVMSGSSNRFPMSSNSMNRRFATTKTTPPPPKPREKKNKENQSEDLINVALTTLLQVQERNSVNETAREEIDIADAVAALVKFTIRAKTNDEKPGAVAKLVAFLPTL